MILLFGIIFLILGFIMNGYATFSIHKEYYPVSLILMIGATIIITADMIIDDIYLSKPQAIDVYRGKTTLKITYKDSIPIDSVVVFKTK
jgi:hypothetical protein